MRRFATRRPPRQKLLLFARVPELGRVKTRLARDLGAERTLELHEAMLRDVLRSIGPSDDAIDIEVMWTGSEDVDGDALRRAFGNHTTAMQSGATLGDRLAMAFSERIFFHGVKKIVAIGTDDPTLSRRLIEDAFHILDCCEWVVGPAIDGGYYLIGCRAGAYDSSAFHDVPWGTAQVFEETMLRIRNLGATVATLPQRLDIDHLEDLHTYPTEAGSAVGTVLEQWGWTR